MSLALLIIVREEVMSNITIGRYGPAEAKLEDGTGYSAWIEGTDDSGASWIFWLDDAGRPCTYYARRDPDGGVLGEPVRLTPDPLDVLDLAE
jgi:hypothetical protein